MTASRTGISSMRVSYYGSLSTFLLTAVSRVFVDIQGERHAQPLSHIDHPPDFL